MTKGISEAAMRMKEAAPDNVKEAVSQLCKKTQGIVIELLQEALQNGSPRSPKEMILASSMTDQIRTVLEWGGLSWENWTLKEGAEDVRIKIDALELFREEKDSQCEAFGETPNPDCGFCRYKGEEAAQAEETAREIEKRFGM